MNILFIIDRIELKYFEFNDLVTNFWLIKELLERKNDVFISTIDKLSLQNGIPFVSGYYAYEKAGNIFFNKDNEFSCKIEEFQLVMFRPDPPVDLDYINATYIFDFVDKTKTFIMNDTKAIRDFNEKLHAAWFNDLMPRNIVTSSVDEITQFLQKNEEIILKPLNKCFGAGVMYLKKGDKNTAVIINSMTNNGTTLVMVQKYLSSVQNGDKRVLLLGDKVCDYCVRKLPSRNDFKFNEHCDANIQKDELDVFEKADFTRVANVLNSHGIYMAGLDVIDKKIIEINVTSPCYFIREINNAYNVKFEKTIVDYILQIVQNYFTRENTSTSTSSNVFVLK